MSVAGLVREDFAAHVGSVFTLLGEESTTMPLTLTEAIPGAASGSTAFRAPFMLVFRSTVQEVVPQGLYALEHPAMGTLEIFLAPSGRNAAGVEYAATFN